MVLGGVDQPGVRLNPDVAIGLEILDQRPPRDQGATTDFQNVMMRLQAVALQKFELADARHVIGFVRIADIGLRVRPSVKFNRHLTFAF
jgi:hypothetical protein